MTPMSYLMGLIEGTPNNEFVSGPTRPEVTRALEILREERSFVIHAQRSLQIREGTLITQINAGERRLMGFDNAGLRDAFYPHLPSLPHVLWTTLLPFSDESPLIKYESSDSDTHTHTL